MNRRSHHLTHRIWLGLIIVVGMCQIFGTGSVVAQDHEQLFEHSVSLYQRGLFDSAATSFLTLAGSGIDDYRVWYNLGNAHFKAGRIGGALVAYQRGLRRAPRDADLMANFRYVRLFAADKIDPVGVFFLERWWQSVVGRISSGEARWLAGLMMWIAAFLTILRMRPGVRTQISSWTVGVVWLVWLTATGLVVETHVRDEVRMDGAVTVVKTDVRRGPGDGYTLQFVGHDGLFGTVERSESGWHLVRFPNGLKGWLATEDFEII